MRRPEWPHYIDDLRLWGKETLGIVAILEHCKTVIAPWEGDGADILCSLASMMRRQMKRFGEILENVMTKTPVEAFLSTLDFSSNPICAFTKENGSHANIVLCSALGITNGSRSVPLSSLSYEDRDAFRKAVSVLLNGEERSIRITATMLMDGCWSKVVVTFTPFLFDDRRMVIALFRPFCSDPPKPKRNTTKKTL